MLETLRLVNFKCFADTGDVSLGPLTLIFGKNNSGKSSIFHSLLVLRQSLEAGIGQRLSINGPLYSGGSYTDLVHQHRVRNHVEMHFSITPSFDSPQRLEMEFAADEPNPPRLSRLKVTGAKDREVVIRRGRGAGGPYELVIDGERIGRAREGGFNFLENRLFPFLLSESLRGRQSEVTRDPIRIAARRTFTAFERVLRGMRSVGAFRKQPERRYEYQGLLPGLRDTAENVIAALIDDATRRRARSILRRTLNRWLRQVGRVQLLPIRRISTRARLFELRLRDTDSGRWANFADVGFGIGQAFPVLVEGLRTPEGGLLLVQEPEIHLHPDAQLAMADFLVDLVETGKQVLVETHSEHLLLRVRHLLARHRAGRTKRRLTPQQVRLLYVDKDRSGRSEIRPIEIDKLGQVKNWPTGFMEEATRERIEIMKAFAS